MTEKSIVKREVRFAIHIPKNSNNDTDYHYVKETITYSDGTTQPRAFLIKDFQRPVWITKKAFRNHKEKKEFEDVDKLIKLSSTQSDLNKKVAKYLEKPFMANRNDIIKESPYVYGYDISSTSFIKFFSLKKNNFMVSPYTICSFDIEATPYTNELLLISIAMYDKTYTAVLKSFVKNIKNLKSSFINSRNYYLPNYVNLESEIEAFDNELDVIKAVFKKLNEWMPDFLVIWNMDYDIPFILNKISQYKVNPEYILCDNKLPLNLRIARYKQGKKKKITASGIVKPINPSLQWHTFILTAPFYVIDAMCVYRQLRIAQQEEQSYSLDYILQKELGSRKLKFTFADKYVGVNWHLFMQSNYPLEYIIYNLYDCLSVLELDNKTKDISITLPSFLGISDFSNFDSNPKKITDALFLFGLEKNKIIGVGYKKINKKEEDIDDENINENEDEEDVNNYSILSLKDWIQTLPQHLLIKDGLKCLEDYPNIITNIRAFVFDADVSSSYPSVTRSCNVSKETTLREVITIDGVKEETFRLANLGIPIGNANILSYFNSMFNMPKLTDLMFKK